MKTTINENLYQYLLQFGTREHPILSDLRLYTSQLENFRMQIPPDQAQFMMLLAKVMNAKRYLEIGVFTGYSTLAMALSMGDDSSIVALEKNNEYINIAIKFWGMAQVVGKIRLFIQDAMISCEELLQNNYTNYFDIAFIDADKTNILQYYEYCLQLIRPHGIILIDNVLYHGKVLDKDKCGFVEKICEFNEFIYNDCRVEISMIPIGDGLTLAFKK